MVHDSPFFTSRIECPICRTVNEIETVRVGAYVEKGRDTDFCPSEIEWRYPKYQSRNPLLYFTATCSNCFYTREFNNSFKEWKKDTNFVTYRLKAIKPQHLDQLAVADSPIKRMGETIDTTRFPNESAIIKLHLAAFDEALTEHPVYLDLGRFYLRMGWIYRAMSSQETPSSLMMSGIVNEIDNRYAALSSHIDGYQTELEHFQRHATAQFDSNDIPAEMKSQMSPFKEKFELKTLGCVEKFSELKAVSDKLGDLMTEYKNAMMGVDGGGIATPFGGEPSFLDFLKSVRRQWDGVALNERQALEKAVAYYQTAFKEGREISPGYQQLQASYMIAELSRRIGDYDGARQYFNSTIKYGQEFVYRNRNDRSRTALARKILELAIEQGRTNMESIKES